MNLDFVLWDWVLLVVVTSMATLIAYLHHPKWKAFILALPVPFTVACLSLGTEINATHALGCLFLLLYTHGVRGLHVGVGLPIVTSIVLSALAYAVVGRLLAQFVPRSAAAFWVACGVVFMVSLALHLATSGRTEPGHRTPLPVWIKLPIIISVVLLLIVSKKLLQGFMTLFPMVSLIAAYEARHSLWTICRTVPAFSLCLIPMMASMRLTQPHLGLGASLAVGWVLYLALLLPLKRSMWAAAEKQESEDASDNAT